MSGWLPPVLDRARRHWLRHGDAKALRRALLVIVETLSK
jgi:hypothetical protein